jgi:hypothetical protein
LQEASTASFLLNCIIPPGARGAKGFYGDGNDLLRLLTSQMQHETVCR